MAATQTILSSAEDQLSSLLDPAHRSRYRLDSARRRRIKAKELSGPYEEVYQKIVREIKFFEVPLHPDVEQPLRAWLELHAARFDAARYSQPVSFSYNVHLLRSFTSLALIKGFVPKSGWILPVFRYSMSADTGNGFFTQSSEGMGWK